MNLKLSTDSITVIAISIDIQFGVRIGLGGRRSGLMVSALISESSNPSSSPGRDIALCWARHFTLIHVVSLSTQVYKWVPANLMVGVALRCASIPSIGSKNTPSRVMLEKLGQALA